MFLAGIVSTVAAAWVTNKIRIYQDNRKLHHDDLRQGVLTPIREVLASEYRQLVLHSTAVVSEEWGRKSVRQAAGVTEDSEVHGPVLKVFDPRNSVEEKLDKVLFEDARHNHHSRILSEWEEFVAACSAHARRCEEWVSRMAAQILDESSLAAHPAKAAEPYVMHLRLACYLYMRCFGLPVGALRKVNSEGKVWLQNSGTLATGTDEQIDKLVELLDTILEGEGNSASSIRQQAEVLRSRQEVLIRRLGLALAEKRLRGTCSLVMFL